MKQYGGLEVSQAETAVCVIDETGQTRWAGTCRSTPDAIGRTLRQRAPEAAHDRDGNGASRGGALARAA